MASPAASSAEVEARGWLDPAALRIAAVDGVPDAEAQAQLADIAQEITHLATLDVAETPSARIEQMMNLAKALEKALEITDAAVDATEIAVALDRWRHVLSPDTIQAVTDGINLGQAGVSALDIVWTLFADDLIDHAWPDAQPAFRDGVKYTVQSGLLISSAKASGSLAATGSFTLGAATVTTAQVGVLGPLGLTQIAMSAIAREARTLREQVDRTVLGYELMAQAALVRQRLGLADYADIRDLHDQILSAQDALMPAPWTIGGAITEDGARKLQILRGLMLAKALQIDGRDHRAQLDGVLRATRTMDENERNLMIQGIMDFARWATDLDHGLYTEYLWRVAQRFDLDVTAVEDAGAILNQAQAVDRAVALLMGDPYGRTRAEVTANIRDVRFDDHEICGDGPAWIVHVRAIDRHTNGGTPIAGDLVIDGQTGALICAALPFLD